MKKGGEITASPPLVSRKVNMSNKSCPNFKKKIYIAFLAVCFVLAGCTAAKNAVKAYNLAQHDPAIVLQMQAASRDSFAIARSVAVAFPGVAPYADIIGQLAGMIGAFAVGMRQGRKKRESEG